MALHGYKRWKLNRHDREQTFDPGFKSETRPNPKHKREEKIGTKVYFWDPEKGWTLTYDGELELRRINSE